ncbi:MAG: GAF domain-containing protein, partial [Chloroflexota bacterium]|nr:GAF domain-containing protein [Chloroflexota bacterium]
MAQEGETPVNASKARALDIELERIADFWEDGLLVVNADHRTQFANVIMRQRMSPSDQSYQGRRCYEAFENRDTPCNIPLWKCPLSKVLQSGNPAKIIHFNYSPGEDTAYKRYTEIAMYPITDAQGNINRLAETRRDVTAERGLENYILRHHHHMQALDRISSAVSGLWDLDAVLRVSLEGVLEIIDGDIGGILLLERESLKLRYRVHRGLSATYVEQVQIGVGEGIAGRVAQNGEPILVEDISRDPRTVYPDLVSTEGLKGFASVPLKAKEKVVGVMNIASHDPGQFGTDDLYLLDSIGCQVGTAIEQARLYQRLARGRERYQALLQHSLTAQEEERKRIARELHDETSQAVTSLTLNLQALRSMAEVRGITDAEFTGMFDRTQAMATYAGTEIVRMMKELRPTLLDELGLAAAVNRYARNTLEPLEIEVETEFIGMDEHRVPSEIEVTFFRISQGVIGNIREHSEAKQVSIRLEATDKECILRIKDDGKGFDVSTITKVDDSGRGAGLFIMRERANLMGGTANVISQP